MEGAGTAALQSAVRMLLAGSLVSDWIALVTCCMTLLGEMGRYWRSGLASESKSPTEKSNGNVKVGSGELLGVGVMVTDAEELAELVRLGDTL